MDNEKEPFQTAEADQALAYWHERFDHLPEYVERGRHRKPNTGMRKHRAVRGLALGIIGASVIGWVSNE